MKAGLPRTQKGAAAIEFAAVFVIFFAVFYGLVSYTLPLLMMQSFNQATAEAVRRSVALDPATPGYATALTTLARNTLRQQLTWIPPAFNFNADTDASVTYVGGLLTVRVNYSRDKLRQVIPFLVLPGVGSVPALPENLSAQSSLQF
ncbi:TadE/TadG family type IV pilus assembly protein [Pseudomonas sp. NPDC089530]|uniref:TadE/TadG family type IV pilus assembly protein n=1 Tax=Pseudomonas sp. NPDC089530 TaxID=3390651 RepID=UPI003D0202DA